MNKAKNKPSTLSKVARIGLAVTGIVFVILLCVGAWKDSMSERCQGLMGANISCVESYALYPFSFVGVPIVGLLVAVIAIDYMSKEER